MFRGLNKYKIERILIEKMESDPDLKYYLNDESLIKAINLLIKGIAEVIDENNKELERDFKKEIRHYWYFKSTFMIKVNRIAELGKRSYNVS